MDKMTIELCPETGLCSLVKGATNKIDLLPFEVEALKAAGTDLVKLRQVIDESDSAFAKGMTDQELLQLANQLAKRRG